MSFASDLTDMHAILTSLCHLEKGDVVTDAQADGLALARHIITKIVAAPKPAGPDAPGAPVVS